MENAQHRTDAKIRYARLHMGELLSYSRKGSGDDFERSHIESFLYHLLGVRDAFLQELNLYYDCKLAIDKVSGPLLKEKMKAKGLPSQELDEILFLEAEDGSWLNDAKEMRHHATHRRSVSREFFVGGNEDGQVHLKNPKSGLTIKEDFGGLFKGWCNEMERLIGRLRKSALERIQI